MFISAVDSTIVNVALPQISRDLNARVGDLQWVIDAFLVCLAGSLLLGSGLADHFGRRRVFLLGLAGFTVTSILAALSQNIDELIAARALMGLAAACVLPPALPLLAVMFPPAERARPLAVWTAVAGIGFGLGPALGGVLVQVAGWQAVFLVSVPVTIAAVPVGMYSLPESRRPGAPPIDLVGVGLSIVSLACIVYALIDGVHAGWTQARVLTVAIIGLLAAIGFVRCELRSSAPLFDVNVLRRPAVAIGSAIILAVYLSLLGVMFLLPQYLHYVRHESILIAGLMLAPLGAACLVFAPFSLRVESALGTGRAIAAGLFTMAVGVALLLLIRRDAGVAFVILGVTLFGAMIPLTVMLSTGVVMNDLGKEKAGDGGAVNQLARQVGGALGVAVIGSVFAAVYSGRISSQLVALAPALRHRAAQSIEEAQTILGTSGPIANPHQPLQLVSHSFDVAARVGFASTAALLLAMALLAAVTLSSYRRPAPEAAAVPVVRALDEGEVATG